MYLINKKNILLKGTTMSIDKTTNIPKMEFETALTMERQHWGVDYKDFRSASDKVLTVKSFVTVQEDVKLLLIRKTEYERKINYCQSN